MARSDGTFMVQCPCKQVELRIQGEPLNQAYCHCKECQTFMQADVFFAVIYAHDQVEVVSGKDGITDFSVRDPKLLRVFCQVLSQSAQTMNECLGWCSSPRVLWESFMTEPC